jgi:hypothetical protein
VNQESFLLQRITKAREQLKKQKHDNREKELTIRMIGYMKNKQMPDDLSVSDLKEFNKLIEKNLKEIDNKIVELN